MFNSQTKYLKYKIKYLTLQKKLKGGIYNGNGYIDDYNSGYIYENSNCKI